MSIKTKKYEFKPIVNIRIPDFENSISQRIQFDEMYNYYWDDINMVSVYLVTFAYLRINGTQFHSKLSIPQNASVDTLDFHNNDNFFVDIFNRYKIICEANQVISDTASILQNHFMSGVEKISAENQRNIAQELLKYDWNQDFTDKFCCWYFEEIISRYSTYEYFAEDTTSIYPALYCHAIDCLAPLLNIQPHEKQLCSSIFYNSYLFDLFEQLGWRKHGGEKIVRKHLSHVTAIQADPVLWALHTIESVLCGCNDQLTLNAEALSTMHSTADNRYDVIFLPEVSRDSVPDLGAISIDNIVIEKSSFPGTYHIAFLYNLLSENGRMILRFDERGGHELLNAYDVDFGHCPLWQYFVDNNLIEVILQIGNCYYILIDKNRPEARHNRVLFYYFSRFCDIDKMKESLLKYSTENISINHDEGACIVSNQEIRLNHYCMLPKKYIYDFNRVKQQVESDMIQHIRHEANQLIPRIGRSLKSIGLFLKKHGLDNEPSQEKLDKDDVVPSVKELIDGSRNNLLQLQSVFSVTREIVLETFDKSNFNTCDMNKLFAEISNYKGHKKYSIQVKGSVKSSPIIYKNAFRDMIENIISNAENHGFKDGRTDYRIVFDLSQKGRRIVIKCLNNGEPLPPNFTKDRLFAKGDKGHNSNGMGLGGERIGKILAAHNAGFDVLPIGKLPQGFTVGFEIILSGERDTNEQGK